MSIPVAVAFGNGVNLQPSYYNNGNVTFGWNVMKKYSQIKQLRIEIEPDKVVQGKKWIQDAHNQGYQLIVTYHKYVALGSDDENEIIAAANWWVANYEYLKPKGGDFTINLINEWGSHSQSAATYSKAYNTAVAIVRTVYSHDIIIDISGWGQNTHVAAQASPMLSDTKLILSAHIYPQGNQEGHYNNNADMDELKGTGRPCIIGEFGTIGNGGVDVYGVVTHAKSIGFLGVYAWAWNGDGGDMNMMSPKWVDNPVATTYDENDYFYELIGLL